MAVTCKEKEEQEQQQQHRQTRKECTGVQPQSTYCIAPHNQTSQIEIECHMEPHSCNSACGWLWERNHWTWKCPIVEASSMCWEVATRIAWSTPNAATPYMYSDIDRFSVTSLKTSIVEYSFLHHCWTEMIFSFRFSSWPQAPFVTISDLFSVRFL